MTGKEKIPILIVDDRIENLLALELLLEGMELDLVRADSGNEALRQTLRQDFALVLLDVQMPEMDGFETAELMRSNPRTRQLPVIFLTAGIKEEHLLFKGYETGAVDYLIKPVEPQILRGKVRVFCELYLQRLELERTREALEARNAELRENQAKLEEQHRRLQELFCELQQESERRVRASEELLRKEQLLIQQSRLAAMGEMIGNIAHQWRQPLNTLSLLVQEPPLLQEIVGEVTQEHLEQNSQKAMALILHMSRTIEDFRNFFKPNKEKLCFRVQEELQKALSLVDASFHAECIELAVENRDDPVIHGYPSEFSQVLLNILTNAKDALIERRTESPKVWVTVAKEEARAVVTITDNAGGICDDVILKIFDPYFTTKGPQTGTGVGLFMSKTIIEKNMGGRLTVANTEQGAQFTIVV